MENAPLLVPARDSLNNGEHLAFPFFSPPEDKLSFLEVFNKNTPLSPLLTD